MSIIDKYLNLNPNLQLLQNLGIELNSNILLYGNYYKEFISNPEYINNFIREQFIKYINKKYTLININDADINYYIKYINLFVKDKFSKVITDINIDHIISMTDYSLSSKNYLYWRNEYYKIIYNSILLGVYKPVKFNKKEKLLEIINENWSKISFDNIIEFANTLNKIKFFGQNVDDFIVIISNKFDDNENIKKLLDYIDKTFNNNLSDTINYDNNENNSELSKYNFRFIVDNLKSNGYLLFEEFSLSLKNKYKKQQKIETIKSDKSLISYFMYIVSKKDANSVNRKVNEILIRIRDYLYDIEDSYYCNIGYQKITVTQESEKYKLIDLSSYNRSNALFSIFKYSHVNKNAISNFNLTNTKIEPYFDIYKAFYTSRYPDRNIEFDCIFSTMIVKMIFLEESYYIHMALIQYLVLDKIFKSNEGVGINQIVEMTEIPIEYILETINSLIQIKLIKRTGVNTIDTLRFFINYDFVHENNKISISSLIIKELKEINNTTTKEFLHDRNTIVLANMYDYIKKNKIFYKDVLFTDLQYKVPFKLTDEYINTVIQTLLDKEHIMLLTENTYKYIE